MRDPLDPLTGAVEVGAEGVRLAGQPHQRPPADRAALGEPPAPLAPAAALDDRPDHLGDDVAGLAHHHRVARAHVLQPDLILVVQGGEGDGRAAHEHRPQPGERRGLAGAADRDLDGHQFGRALLGRELVGDRPSRRAGGRAELALQREVVDLDHHTVDLVVEVVAALLPAAAEGECVLEPVHDPPLGVDREPGSTEPVHRLGLRGGELGRHRHTAGGSLELAHLVRPEGERTARGDRRVLLAQRARGRVARIDEEAIARLGLPPVEVLERRDRHVDLPAHLDHPGRRADVGREPLGYGVDGRDVGGHVLAGAAVPAGRPPDVAPVRGR